MRKFNVTGICVPDMHYMVDISEKTEKIFKLVEGKNTLLSIEVKCNFVDYSSKIGIVF